jgi:Domain of unknown function (DUF397)
MDWRRSSYSMANGNCVEVAAGWRKSSYSNGHSACVEVAAWRKSSHSALNGCVETATGCGQVRVRDSKDPEGGHLTFTPGDWMAFLETIR